MRTADQWMSVLTACGVKIEVAQQWGPVFADTVKDDTFAGGDAEIDDFLGQVLVECAMLTKFEENLHYSAERLMAVWPHRFPTLEAAAPFANNPKALANNVYGGRMGNVQPDDGWTFRGQGVPMLTGRSNYETIGVLMGQDLTTNPDMLQQPHYSLEAAIAFWKARVPQNSLGNCKLVTYHFNGGNIGLSDRESCTALATGALVCANS